MIWFQTVFLCKTWQLPTSLFTISASIIVLLRIFDREYRVVNFRRSIPMKSHPNFCKKCPLRPELHFMPFNHVFFLTKSTVLYFRQRIKCMNSTFNVFDVSASLLMEEGKNRPDPYPPKQWRHANPAKHDGNALRFPRWSASVNTHACICSNIKWAYLVEASLSDATTRGRWSCVVDDSGAAWNEAEKVLDDSRIDLSQSPVSFPAVACNVEWVSPCCPSTLFNSREGEYRIPSGVSTKPMDRAESAQYFFEAALLASSDFSNL